MTYPGTMAGSDDQPDGYSGSVPLVVVCLGGFLMIATGLSITVLAFVLVNTLTGGKLAVATVALGGILAGVGIYYVGMGELLESGL